MFDPVGPSCQVGPSWTELGELTRLLTEFSPIFHRVGTDPSNMNDSLKIASGYGRVAWNRRVLGQVN